MAAKMGKTYRGQRFYPVTTPAQVQERLSAQEPYGSKEGAIPIDVWLASIGVNDLAERAGMRAYTLVHTATPKDWETIFAPYFGVKLDPEPSPEPGE